MPAKNRPKRRVARKLKTPAEPKIVSWKDVTPVDFTDFLVGNEEGGFLGLEEIDGDVYLSGQDNSMLEPFVSSDVVTAKTVTDPSDSITNKNSLSASGSKKKRKRAGKSEDGHSKAPLEVPDVAIKENSAKKSTNKNKLVLKVKESSRDETANDFEDVDMSEWHELRLHPLLERALAAKGFQVPTPIQRKCIPAAAHQGKDVIGAAETGSGKTLAFGLPILQRLLEGREKEERKKESEPSSNKSDLKALILTPTRELALQVSEHLKSAARFSGIRVVPIVGGIAPQKQQRLLKGKPEIVVATPGRLWELMSAGEQHLLHLQQLSFFVLDEADRMVEKGHFRELQSIIEMLPSKQRDSEEAANESSLSEDPSSAPFEPHSSHELRARKRQIMVFSATLSLPPGFRRKLKRVGAQKKQETDSVASLIERLGMSPDSAIVDLTTESLVASKVQESVIHVIDSEKDVHLCYFLSLHGNGRTLVFCTSISAVRRVAALLAVLKFSALSLHAQMQQRQRLKALDRFRASESGILIATDVAARGLDIPGVNSIIHYQMPHDSEVYIHRCGRTARAGKEGCTVALVSPSDRQKYNNLMRMMGKPAGLPPFPVRTEYMAQLRKCVNLAGRIDKAVHQSSQKKADAVWLEKAEKELELDQGSSAGKRQRKLRNSAEEEALNTGDRKVSKASIKSMQKELEALLRDGLLPKAFSKGYFTGRGVAPSTAEQIQAVNRAKKGKQSKQQVGDLGDHGPMGRSRFVVIGHHSLDAIAALQQAAGVVNRE